MIRARLAKALEGKTLLSPDQPEWVRLEFPEWLGDSLHRIFGDTAGCGDASAATPRRRWICASTR